MKMRVLLGVVVCVVILGLGGCSDDDSSPTQPQLGYLTYVAMGASDAVGIGATPVENGYVYRIRDGLYAYAASVAFTNLGISGARIGDFIEIELPAAIAAQPNLVTIWVGVNDISDQMLPTEFEASLEQILSQLCTATVANIVIADIPDLTRLPIVATMGLSELELQQLRTLVLLYNAVISRQAAKYGAYLVELSSSDIMSNPAYICEDGFHPSNAGYARLAELFLDVIKRLYQKLVLLQKKLGGIAEVFPENIAEKIKSSEIKKIFTNRYEAEAWLDSQAGCH